MATASASLSFQWRATFSARGSSGLGALSSAWMLRIQKGTTVSAHCCRTEATPRPLSVAGIPPLPYTTANNLGQKVETERERKVQSTGVWQEGGKKWERRKQLAEPRQDPPATCLDSRSKHIHQRLLVGAWRQRLGAPDQDGADLKGGAPLVLQDVQADAAQLVNVGVVDFGEEADLQSPALSPWQYLQQHIASPVEPGPLAQGR